MSADAHTHWTRCRGVWAVDQAAAPRRTDLDGDSRAKLPAAAGGLPVTGVTLETGESPVGPAIVWLDVVEGDGPGQWQVSGSDRYPNEMVRIRCLQCGLWICLVDSDWSVARHGLLWPRAVPRPGYTALACPGRGCTWQRNVVLRGWRDGC